MGNRAGTLLSWIVQSGRTHTGLESAVFWIVVLVGCAHGRGVAWAGDGLSVGAARQHRPQHPHGADIGFGDDAAVDVVPHASQPGRMASGCRFDANLSPRSEP